MSDFTWSSASEGEKAAQAEKIPEGEHEVTITKVIHGGKNGPFLNKNGDPMILLIFIDDQAREASQMYTLSEKAAWSIAKLLTSFQPPADLTKMDEASVTPLSFADPDFAAANLIDRKLMAEIQIVEGAAGVKYHNVLPIKGSSPQAETAVTVAEDDIPF